ncbi:hypothetical protein [Mucilaginibacter sp. SG564]|uniref:hypothetical protein n=1 Tax=Mucilaginibacter sp. SG564 TaxID=2587022 RepID=UPI001557730B|nr:hypothetical protein [Mucilaginibacter sp. SG564]
MFKNNVQDKTSLFERPTPGTSILENPSSYHVRDDKRSFTYFTSFLKLNSFKLQILLARQINFMHFYKN